MRIKDNYLHELTDTDATIVSDMQAKLLFHLEHTLKMLFAARENYFLTEVYYRVAQQLLQTYAETILSAVDNCKRLGDSQPVFPGNFSLDVEKLVASEFGITYPMLPKTVTAKDNSDPTKGPETTNETA